MANLKIVKEDTEELGSCDYHYNPASVFSDLCLLDLNQPPCSWENPFAETDQIQEEEPVTLNSSRVRASDEGIAVRSSGAFGWDLNQPLSEPEKERSCSNNDNKVAVGSTGLYFLDLNEPLLLSTWDIFGETDKLGEERNLSNSRVRARASDDAEGLHVDVDEQAGKRRKTTLKHCDKQEESQAAGLQNIAAGEDEMLYCDEGVLLMCSENSADDYADSTTIGGDAGGFPSPVVSSDDVQDDFYVQLQGFPSPVVLWGDDLEDLYYEVEGLPSPVVSLAEVQDDTTFSSVDDEMFELTLDHEGDDLIGTWLRYHFLDDDEPHPHHHQLYPSEAHRAVANVAPAA